MSDEFCEWLISSRKHCFDFVKRCIERWLRAANYFITVTEIRASNYVSFSW